MLKALGQSWQADIEPNWDGFYENEKRRRLKLPTYPFERQRCWIDFHAPKVADEAEPALKVDSAPVSSNAEYLVVQQLELISKQLDVLQATR